MTDKYHSDTKEKIETLTYSPGLPTTGDKEPGTHTIVPTARPAIAGAQYSHSLTLLKPSDARLVVKRIASRLNVNIAGLGTATHVYCSVRVDVDDTDHELFNEDWASIGNKLDAVDTYDTSKAVIFNLLKDGAAHTFYFLFWADAASQATIDLVQLWEAVGSNASNVYLGLCLRINHTGLMQTAINYTPLGTGDISAALWRSDLANVRLNLAQYSMPHLIMVKDYIVLGLTTSVPTSLVYLSECYFVVRSEQ